MLDLATAHRIARIRYPELDFDTAWRLAHAHDARTLAGLAAAADRTAAALYEQADDYEPADDEGGANRRNTLASAGSHASRATALRAAADFLTFCKE